MVKCCIVMRGKHAKASHALLFLYTSLSHPQQQINTRTRAKCGVCVGARVCVSDDCHRMNVAPHLQRRDVEIQQVKHKA